MEIRIADSEVSTEQARKKMEDDDDIDIESLLKEGRPSIEDMKCLARAISDNPEELRKLYQLLGLSDDELGDLNDAGKDTIDGAPILRHLKQECMPDITYERIAAVLVNRRDLVVKYCKDLIPTYILARGGNTLAAYQRALTSGKTYDKRVKVLMIGEDRVGKTSLGKALKGEAFDEHEASTNGVLMSEALKNASEMPWRNSEAHRKSSAYKYKCAEFIHQELLRGSTDQLSDETTTKAPAVELTGVTPNTEQPASVQTDGIVPSRATRVENAESIQDNLDLYDEVDNCRNDTDGIWPVIWDFAGQAVYRAIHPIFMSPEAVYVLAFDLSKTLFDRAGGNGGENHSVPNPESEDSNLDHIMRWMDLVHALKRSTDGETLPPVILVGTHADCVKEDSEKIMDCLLDRFCRSKTVLGEHIAGSIAVDNTRAGKAVGQEDPQIVPLRRLILDVANKMPHTKKEVPLQWLYIESKIQEQAQNGVKYIPKGSFKEEIIEKVCKVQDAGDVEPILHFLHDRGTVIYHEQANNPNSLVVLDPQWLVNVLCKIITVVPSREEKINIRSHRIKLQEKGILAKELLDHACKELGVDHVEQSLLFLMEKFNLLFRCPSMDNEEIYLVPCMLTERPGKEIIPTANGALPSPVYLTFKTEYVPAGLFSRLVVHFGVWAATKSSCEQQQIYANAARFVLDGKNFLGLVCFKSVIKLHLWSQDNSDPFGDGDSGFHSEVYSYLKNSLEKMREECHWLRSLSWKLCVQCRLCAGKIDSNTGNCIWHDTNGCLHDDCAHYISLKTRPFHCPDAKGNDPFLPEEKLYPWIQAVDDSNNNNIPADETVGQSALIPGKPEMVLSSLEPLQKAPRSSTNAKQVMLLAGEWGSSKGGLPTINRQLAIELAKSPNLEVTFYLTKCSEEEKRIATNSGITIIIAKERPGYEVLDRLGFPPEELPVIDVVVGHGVKLGKQAQLIQRFCPKCVWIQFEHTAPEELAMYKKYSCNISRGEQKHHTEVQLSALADLVVAVGPKLTEDFKTYLRPYPKKKVFEITPDPSIFHEFKECKQAKEDREKFYVLMFGRGDSEDFELKGFDIAAKAIAELKDQKYHLYSVGASTGSEEEVAEKLLQQGISRRQLSVRGFIESRTKLAKLLCEVDLAIMPSRTEGFGLTALEALSAGLPILVSGNSGFAKALENMRNPLAASCVVDSEDAKDWAAAIQAVKEKPRSQRLQDAKRLKECCEKTFAWSKRCTALMRQMLALVEERRGDNKDCGRLQDKAASDVQSVKDLAEENDTGTQPSPPLRRRPEAVETPEKCKHGWEHGNNSTCSDSELGSIAKVDSKPSISPEVEESIRMENQELNESYLAQDEFQQTKEGPDQVKQSETEESTTKLLLRRGVQWKTDHEGNRKEDVKRSRIEGIKVRNSKVTKAIPVTAAVLLAAMLLLLIAYK
ncbi:uncharacterized protein LOC144638111 isoform X1 [Oculina patagonica]